MSLLEHLSNLCKVGGDQVTRSVGCQEKFAISRVFQSPFPAFQRPGFSKSEMLYSLRNICICCLRCMSRRTVGLNLIVACSQRVRSRDRGELQARECDFALCAGLRKPGTWRSCRG